MTNDYDPGVPDEDKTLGFMDQHSVSRRDLWKALSLGGLAALASGGSTGQVSGQSLGDEPIIELGEDWEVDVDNSTMRFTHVPSGNVWILNDDGAAENFGGIATTIIDDTESPYVTQDEDIIYINDANGAVTVTLASADATAGNEIELVLLDGSNGATVNTEGSETIEPGSVSSKSITEPGWNHSFASDSTDWRTGITLQETGLALPDSATVTDEATALGVNASAEAQGTGDPGVAIGDNASAVSGLAIGSQAATDRDDAIAIGPNVDAAQNSDNVVAIGRGAFAGGADHTIIGAGANARKNNSTLVGNDADADGSGQVLIGKGASGGFDDNGCIAIGTSATAGGGEDAIAIGRFVTVSTGEVARIGGNQLVFGAIEDGQIADGDLNNNELTFDLVDSNNDGTINQVLVRVKDHTGTVRTGNITVN